MKPRRRLLLAAALPLGSRAEPRLRIAYLAEMAGAPGAKRILSAACAQLGIAVEWQAMPLSRAERDLEQGLIDGELLRGPAYRGAREHVLLVEPALVMARFWLHRRPPCAERQSLSELQGQRLAYPRGTAALDAVLAPAQRVAAVTTDDAVRMAALGMADASITVQSAASLREIERKHPELCRVGQALMQMPLSTVLHRRHAALQPRLEAQLRAMKQQGEFERLADEP